MVLIVSIFAVSIVANPPFKSAPEEVSKVIDEDGSTTFTSRGMQHGDMARASEQHKPYRHGLAMREIPS
jgi:hypothetical protein